MPNQPATVFVDPITPPFERDRLLEQHSHGEVHAPFLHVKEAPEAWGFAVHTAEFLVDGERRGDVHVSIAFGNVGSYQRVAPLGDTILSGRPGRLP